MERKLISNFTVEFRLFCKEEGNEKYLNDFANIENSGWKATKGKTIKLNPGDYELFLSGTSLLFENDQMEWHFVSADDKIIAAMLSVNINGVLYYWRIAYNEDFSIYSPGHLLLHKLIENSFNEKSRIEVNFMNERKWLNPLNIKKRRLYDVVIFPDIPILSKLFKVVLAYRYRSIK